MLRSALACRSDQQSGRRRKRSTSLRSWLAPGKARRGLVKTDADRGLARYLLRRLGFAILMRRRLLDPVGPDAAGPGRTGGGPRRRLFPGRGRPGATPSGPRPPAPGPIRIVGPRRAAGRPGPIVQDRPASAPSTAPRSTWRSWARGSVPLLHGGPGTDSSGLVSSVGPLAPAQGLRLIFYDHRGHGRSERVAVGAVHPGTSSWPTSRAFAEPSASARSTSSASPGVGFSA